MPCNHTQQRWPAMSFGAGPQSGQVAIGVICEKKTQAKLASTILGACRAALASLGPDCKYHWDVHIASFWHVQSSNRQQYKQSSTTPSEIRNLNQKLCQAEGLLRELNPGPLAPEARIMPLDQAADGNAVQRHIIRWHQSANSLD